MQYTIDTETQDIIRQQVAGTEHLLWTGRPRQGIIFRGSDAFMIPFSLLWGGFAIFWEFNAVAGKAPFFFRIWGIPFVLVGLYMIIGRFFVDAWVRAKIYYGLTDQRAIIVSGLFSRSVKSLNLRTLSDATLTEYGGDGTITLGPTNIFSSMYQGTPWPGMSQHQPPMFERISDAKSVYEMIRKAQAER